MNNQFGDVSSARGAPMGRDSFGSPEGEIHVFQVRMVDGDYDDGGAYWGGTPSKPLYCARNAEGTYRDFARADSYTKALGKLGLDPQADSIRYHIDDVVIAYMECALFTDAHEFEDDNFDLDDFAPEAWAGAKDDCGDFLAALGGLPKGWDAGQFGHDFWLTRNHHGAGFWDRGKGELGNTLSEMARPYGSVNTYVEDDKIYFD